MLWQSSSGRISLQITKRQAAQASHPGPCDADARALSEVPAIRRQLAKIDPATLRAELAEYGAWDAQELEDRPQNLQRLLWLACGDTHEATISTTGA